MLSALSVHTPSAANDEFNPKLDNADVASSADCVLRQITIATSFKAGYMQGPLHFSVSNVLRRKYSHVYDALQKALVGMEFKITTF